MSKQIEVEVSYDLLEQSRRKAIQDSALQLLEEKDTGGSELDQASNRREDIWPALNAYGHDKNLSQDYELSLLPLSRIGAEQGFSGSSILLGYFRHRRNSNLFPSQPMVIKLRKRPPESFGTLSELRDELHRAERLLPYISYHKSQYAVPLHISDVLSKTEYQVLWSPFALTDLVQRHESALSFLDAPDLRQLLAIKKGTEPTKDQLEMALNVVKSAFQILDPLHKRDGTARSVSTSFQKEYAPYLRKFGESWGGSWMELWGTQRETSDFGVSWLNPFWVLNELMARNNISLRLGAVHGDLHPGNILYATPERPFLIDFGWADDNAHIAKDFVLLECNLRFIYFPADVSFADARQFAQLNAQNVALPENLRKRFKPRHDLIQALRTAFVNAHGGRVDWMEEYVIPLFLVSMGLLRYVDQYANQVAARLTVLELARYISDEYLLSEKRSTSA
ncbi:phosphotransferase [Corallococcus sp. 4LFB]|uniref:phosphotransferase n=1 Tax=Corallococcus sp. 4LFB TaxID=3383249 RepID=UPI003975CB47